MLAPSRVRNRIPQLTIFCSAWSSIGQAWPHVGLTSVHMLPGFDNRNSEFNSQHAGNEFKMKFAAQPLAVSCSSSMSPCRESCPAQPQR